MQPPNPQLIDEQEMEEEMTFGRLQADRPAHETDWKPDPRTVQACIDAFPEAKRVPINSVGGGEVHFNAGLNAAAKALEALLPKRDRAAELVEAYKRRCGDFDNQHDIEMLSDFARDLIETGVIPDDK